MTTIRLQSSDDEIFEVDKKITKCSGTITEMIATCGMGDSDDITVPLPNVKSKTLRKVLHWAEHHQNDPADDEIDENEKKTDNLSAWDAEFLQVDQGTLFDLILAAQYLHTQRLMKMVCQVVADMMKGKTPEEIRKIFRIESS